jgi:pimeloyl-ACP methyl ester carboxylesterase
VPLAVAEGLHRRSRRGELWVVPGGGHALPVTRPRELAERIAAFAGSR